MSALLDTVTVAIVAHEGQDIAALKAKDDEIARLNARIAELEQAPPLPPPPPPPTTTAQYPTLLAKYGARRPAFSVAGVDRWAGCPVGLALKSPAMISMTGVQINTSTRSVSVVGANVTLDGYDFSGWSMWVGAVGTSLLNSRFNGMKPIGAQKAAIHGDASCSNLRVADCTIDGLTGKGGTAEFLINMEGVGLTVERCWLKDCNSDLIGRHNRSGGSLIIHDCLMENAGMAAGSHGDHLQVYGPTIDDTKIMRNTCLQTGGNSQGIIADNTKQAEFGQNVMIGSVSYWMSVSGPNTSLSTFTGPVLIHDNYFDVTDAYGFCYPSAAPWDNSAKTKFTNNMNMVDGSIIQDP